MAHDDDAHIFATMDAWAADGGGASAPTISPETATDSGDSITSPLDSSTTEHFFMPQHSSTTTSPPPPATDPNDRLKKRRANTLAARRYRQAKVDKMASLEAILAAVEAERDALRVKLAKVEGENATLKAVLGSKLGN